MKIKKDMAIMAGVATGAAVIGAGVTALILTKSNRDNYELIKVHREESIELMKKFEEMEKKIDETNKGLEKGLKEFNLAGEIVDKTLDKVDGRIDSIAVQFKDLIDKVKQQESAMIRVSGEFQEQGERLNARVIESIKAEKDIAIKLLQEEAEKINKANNKNNSNKNNSNDKK